MTIEKLWSRKNVLSVDAVQMTIMHEENIICIAVILVKILQDHDMIIDSLRRCSHDCWGAPDNTIQFQRFYCFGVLV